jgi:hypothetical protein
MKKNNSIFQIIDNSDFCLTSTSNKSNFKTPGSRNISINSKSRNISLPKESDKLISKNSPRKTQNNSGENKIR